MKIRRVIGIVLILLALSLVLIACSKENEVEPVDIDVADENLEDNVVEDEEEELDEDEILMEEFKEIEESSPQPEELIKFIDENIDKVSALDGDKMIDALERNLQTHIEEYEDRILELDENNELMEISGDEFEFDQSKIDEIENEDLREEVNSLYLNMYKLQNLEGSFYPVIDYGKLKTYKDYITEEWKDYLTIQSLDVDERPMSDGGLNISFDELADRILKIENYLNKYINSQRQSEMLKNYEDKINAYLKGLPNTPIADVDSGEIKEEVLNSYREISNSQDYMTSHTVYEYLQAIKENEYIVDEDILNKADELIEEALRLLREFK